MQQRHSSYQQVKGLDRGPAKLADAPVVAMVVKIQISIEKP